MIKLYTDQLRRQSRLLWLPHPLRNTLLLLIFLATFFSTYAQNENFVINLQDASLKEVMRAIKKQSGYSFLYRDDLLADYGRRDFHIDTNGIAGVMSVLLSGTELTYELDDNVIVLKPEKRSVIAAVTVSGIVKDHLGAPLPGVSVQIKGTSKGTVTDSEGKYSIDVSEDDVIVFSFIGFSPVEMPVKGRTTVDIELKEDISELQEVVITGYQPIRKESFTGRAITITGDELKTFNPVNIFQSIQAYDPSFRIIENNLAGSNPNQLPNVNVRGATGLPGGQLDRNNLTTNPNLPTFIMDGFEVTMQTVYDLDVNRIASITLLKDAAATAIYGSRASNGVLVITTKVPEEGKLRLSYNYELTAITPDLTVYDVLNAKEKLDYEYLAGLYTNTTISGTTSTNALTQEQNDELYYAKKRQVVKGVDSYWLSEPVKTVLGHKNSLTIEAGSKALRYGVTAQYQTYPGVMKGSERNRFGGDVYLSYNMNDKFMFKNTLSVSQVNSQDSPYGSFENYVKMNPYYMKRDSTGKVLRVLDEWVRVNSDASGGTSSSAVLNPLYDASLSSFNKTKYVQIINSFMATWKITHDLQVKGTLTVTKYNGDNDKFTSPLSNQYYNYSSSDYNKRGEYYYKQDDQSTVDGNILLSYNTSINKHIINAAVGGNVKEFKSTVKEFSAIGFTNDKFTNISFASRYYENDSPNGVDETNRLIGSFLTLNYSFDDRFLLDVTGRMDGSSKFGTDKKYAPFWATGIGWNLHKEAFMEQLSFVNQFRLRATTGSTGGVSFPPYLGKTTYEYYHDWYSTGVGAQYLGYGNDNLKWQRTRNYDLGTDIMLFNNRISFSPTYYYKLTQDLIQDIAVPPSLGFSSYKDNLGEIENKGFEIALKVNVLKRRNWNVNLNTSLSHNRNKLKSISSTFNKFNQDADAQQEEEAYRAVPLLRFYEGRSLETIYAVPSKGIDPENGKEIYVKKDGSLTYDYDVKDIAPVGVSTPKIYGFFGGSASYKNVMLYVSFYTRAGGQQYNQTLVDRVENADPRYNVDQRVLDQRWKKPGDHTFYKNIADLGTTRATSRFVQTDRVVELKSVSLSYDVTSAIKNKLHMSVLRFVLTSNDVWRWSAVKMERGIDYPFARSFTFSVQTRF